jgi:hypothetical protein
MNKSLLALLLLLPICGCVPKDYFRTEIGDAPCLSTPGENCASANLVVDGQDDYMLGFVEIDDRGRFYDQRQADALLTWLKNERQPQYVVVYTHGWHHNASATDSNVRRFRDSLRDIKQRNPQYQVVGIYVGWRGETLDLPWLRLLTFWDRKAVSETIGRSQLLNFLLQLETAVKADAGEGNKLLTIGHSLGATVIFNALQGVLLERLTHADGTQPAGFGDLVVLVNPAFEASRFSAIRAAAENHRRESPLADQPSPLLLIATSEADAMTKTAFSWSRVVPALFEPAQTTQPDATLAGVSAWELGTTAIGHFKRFITHRLESNSALAADGVCASGPESPAAAGLRLRHQGNSSAHDPYWVVQVDKRIIPSHGFLRQKSFWCFIEQTMNLTAPNQGYARN